MFTPPDPRPKSLTNREAYLGGWFSIFIGASMLAISVFSFIDAAAPPPTTSLTTSLFVRGLVGLLGPELGHRMYHLMLALGGLALVWLGIKVLPRRG